MNTNTPDSPIEPLWQAARDGDLDAAGRAALDAHLADHPDAAAAFAAESEWLDSLRDEDPVLVGDSDAFKRSVIDAWSAPETAGFVGRWGSAMVAAASIALIAGLMWIAGKGGPLGKPDAPAVAGNPDTPAVPVRPAIDDVRDRATSPVSRFVLSVSGAVDRQPALFRKTLDEAAAALGADDLMKIFPQRPGDGSPLLPADRDATRS